MKCFYDTTADAVGTCKSCGRGLSLAYTTEFPKGLACKGRCEKDVEVLISLIERNVAMSSTAVSLTKGSASNFYASFVLYVIMGGGFLWMGSRMDALTPIFYIGLAFLGFAIYTLIRGVKLSKASKEE